MTKIDYKLTLKNTIVIACYLVILSAAFFGLAQLYHRYIAPPNIAIFKHPIYLTASNAETGLIAFLETNDGKIVYIDNFIDTSLATEEHTMVEEQCGVDVDAVLENKIAGTPLLLPVYDNINTLVCGGHYMVLNMNDNTTYEDSAGGTGMAMIRFRGFFEVMTTAHSGPSLYYHLKAVDVPFEVRNAFAQQP